MTLAFGTGYAIVLGVVLSFSSEAAFEAALPLVLPIFGVVGSFGGITVFTNDRIKGVLEYLVAYGVPPRRLFGDVLIASLALASIVVGASLGAGLGANVARGHSITMTFAILVSAYSVPMALASSAFVAMVGMYWTSLSSPRSGLNSPLGLAPIIGIAPPVLTLFVIGALGGSHFFAVTAAAVSGMVVIVVLLLSLVGRLLPSERLLSPA
jgi:hypothetical protein